MDTVANANPQHRQIERPTPAYRSALMDAPNASSTLIAVQCRVLRVPWNALRTGRTGFRYAALRLASSRGTQRGNMTVVATIHCKVCHAVFALFSDTLFSRGGREKTCDICGYVIAHWTGFRMPTIKFVRLGLPAPRSE